MSNKLNYILFILLAALWGGSYVAIKVVVDLFPPLFDATLRVALAWLFLFIFFRLSKINTRINFETRWRVWIVGLFALGFPFALLFWGENYVSAGLAGILCGTVPLWALILSPIFLPKKTFFTWQNLLGLALGMVGTCVIFWPVLHVSHARLEILGTLAALFTSTSYAIGALLNQRLLAAEKVTFQANIYHQLASSTVFLLLASFFLEHWPSFHAVVSSDTTWLIIIYLGIFSTAVAWLLYYHLIHEWGVIRAVVSTYLVPVMALLWDFIFFHNQPSWSEAYGVIIILAGVVLIQLRGIKISRKFSAVDAEL
jgi:drug/metabolite transporter (DMT)-like permease